MSISAINVASPSFKGTSVTKNGAEYKKTNTGKVIGASIGTALLAIDFCNGANALNNLILKPAKGILGKTVGIAAIAISSAFYIAAGLGLGAIIDGIVNKRRASKADVEQGKFRLGQAE